MQICVYQDAGPRRFAATHCITCWEHTFLGFLFVCLFVCWLTCFFFFFCFLCNHCKILEQFKTKGKRMGIFVLMTLIFLTS